MALNREDKQDIERILKPLAEAAKTNSETIRSQAESVGHLAERMASVETDIGAIKKGIGDQAERHERVSRDLYGKTTEHTQQLATVSVIAGQADDRSKKLSNRFWGLLVVVCTLGLKLIYDLVSRKLNGGP